MGFFIDVFVSFVGLLLILLVITQVVWPFITGEPMFPLFRKSKIKEEISKAEHVLEEVAEVTHLNKVVSEVQRRTADLEKK